MFKLNIDWFQYNYLLLLNFKGFFYYKNIIRFQYNYLLLLNIILLLVIFVLINFNTTTCYY